MAQAVRMPSPKPGVDLRGAVEACVQAGHLDAALDLSVVEFDELAQLSGIAVTAVDASATGIAVHYTVSWSSFHACDDRTFGGRHARLLRGRVDGPDWVFERHQPGPSRHDASDEL